MKLVQYTAPTIEPVTLAELKLHLRHDSGSFADQIDETQSISPGSHAIANNYTTHVGTGVSVLGYNAVVVANFGILTVGGVVDIKIQESDQLATGYTDWTGGAFTQATIGASPSTQEKAYTGSKAYIRTVAKVITQAAEFSTTVIRLAATDYEDDLLTTLITAAREQAETITRRQLITATWDMYLDRFPDKNYIQIPFGNLASVTHIKYTDCDGTETTMTVTTDYLVETNGDNHGRIVLPYGGSWPSAVLYPSNPIVIRFVCGYGATAASVPARIKTAIKMICADLWSNREAQVLDQRNYQVNKTAEAILWPFRLWGEY